MSDVRLCTPGEWRVRTLESTIQGATFTYPEVWCGNVLIARVCARIQDGWPGELFANAQFIADAHNEALGEATDG